MTLRASTEGLVKIRQARMYKGWTVDDPRWLWQASQLLEPNVNWQPEGPFADGLSMPTWKRFLAGKESIKVPAFQIFCQVLGLNWQEVCTSNFNRDATESIREFYVERVPYEEECYRELLNPGSLIRIKAPQQMGKTLLLQKILEKIADRGYRTVSLSFKLADRIHFSSLDKLLRWLSTNVSRELGLPSQLDEYWDEEGIGSKSSCSTYFEEYLLAQAETPLVLGLDDVDLVFPYPEVSEDFFALLRSWYEKGRTRKQWKKLRLVVIHSTEIYIRLNIDQSPFNVGLPIELPEFSQAQVQDLAKQHGLNWKTDDVEELMQMVGGHSDMVQQALYYLKNRPEISLKQLLETAPTEAGIYSNRLREHLLNLQKNPALAVALKKVITATENVRLSPMEIWNLQRMGLVKLQGNEVKSRCNLYSFYFGDRLS
ncbi:AAA-like domain-containing protein [Merismopedia glauca]|nr:AAA-like domain-containing protein [Merismopedia glauca]